MQPDARLRFDNFVVGSANRLAVAAARAVAESPGSVYTPLVIYGSPGLGKTHLMSAIGNHVTHRPTPVAVEMSTLDDFVAELHAAIADGDLDRFTASYLNVGVLLIDDIQLLTGHGSTQDELLRILGALQEGGTQIVMTSDRAPAEIADVDARLLTRLSGGLIVDVGAPDLETRMAILNGKCEERGVRFRGGVIEELARLEFKNIRELQGALNRLIAHQTLGGGQQIDPREVMTIIGDLVEQRSRAAAPRPANEFGDFLSGIQFAVSQHVDQWKPRVTEAITYWQGERYRTGPLERALNAAAPTQPVEDLLRAFETSVATLRGLQKQVARLDAVLAGHEAFLDPDRMADAEQLLERALRTASPPPGPSAAFTRAAFEVGASNQLAVRAADAVIADPARRYNPLFIHGPSGVGKTHLLNAIGHELARVIPDARGVACVPAQVFIDELVAALQDGTVDRWRARYCTASALLIDDVQFVAGKERTQEELFHVFNALHADHRQIVLISDRPPRELTGLEERLRSRFEGGLVISMQSPDRALRERLYSRFLTALGVKPTGDMVAYLGATPAASVREIYGTANRIVASAEVKSAPVTLSFLRSELDAEIPAVQNVTPIAATPSSDPFFLDREKMIWPWPDISQRLIEEFR